MLCFAPMSSKDRADVVHTSPIFSGLPANDLAALAGAAREVSYRAREYVFHEGEPAAWFCLVKHGHVKIVRHAKSGKDVVLELVGPGEPFGGVAVIERRPYPASTQTTEPSVVIKIPHDVVVALAERYPAIVREMALLIGQRLRAAHESVTSLAADPVEARLAAALLRLAEREGVRKGKGATLSFPLTRQSLADMSGTTVETTIRVLGRWQHDGLVRDDGGHLVLPDLARLRARAEAEGS
jgi:CRP/FNR family transcriptional regulator, nitrogen oxide reductase regulator